MSDTIKIQPPTSLGMPKIPWENLKKNSDGHVTVVVWFHNK